MDFCDSESRGNLVETEKQLLETGLSTEFQEDLNIAIGENDSEDELEKSDTQRRMDDDEKSEQDIDTHDESLSSNENSKENEDDEEVSEDETEQQINIVSKNRPTNEEDDEESIENEESMRSDASDHSDDKGLWEDIYGRQRDKEGNVVSSRYVPPAARVTTTEMSIDGEKARRFERQLKGILNRLAEQNMHTIANQVYLVLYDV